MKGKILIWGTGNLIRGHKQNVDLSNVIAFIDSDPKRQGIVFQDKPVISPESIKNMSFDKLIIFVSKQYDEIYQYAIKNLGIQPCRISYWSHYYGCYHMGQTYKKVEEECKKRGIQTLVDWGYWFEENSIYCNRNLEIWGCGDGRTKNHMISQPLYKKRIRQLKEMVNTDKIKAIFAGRVLNEDNALVLEAELPNLIREFEAVFFTLPYADTEQNNKLQRLKDTDYGEVTEWPLQFEKLVSILSYQRKSVKLMIATHKEFILPSDPVYQPLWLGDSNANEWNYIEDKQEPSISYLNHKINECTGLYWMWKHLNYDFIGLVHYRRYFLKDEKADFDNVLDEGRIKEILSDFDIITAPMQFTPLSVLNQLKITVEEDAFETGYWLVKNKLIEKHSEYIEAFETVMRGHSLFPCNMFITHKDIFNRYCKWLFSIIIDAAKEIDVSDFADYSKRIIGFFAERLLTVWLLKQQLCIKEMPILVTEKIVDRNTDISRGLVDEREY